jgi:phage baseplate assembly protein W
MINQVQLWRMMELWRIRLRDVTEQGRAITGLLNSSPVDLKSVLGPALLMSQAYTRAVQTCIAKVIADPFFKYQPFDAQGEILELAVSWGQVRSTLGALAFAKRLPTFAAILAATPESIRFGGNARGVTIGSWLEALASAPILAGLSVSTFWSITPGARAALGRMASVDLVLLDLYEFSIEEETLLLLRESVPKSVNITATIREIERIRVPNYHETPTARATLRPIPENMTIQALGQLWLGEPEAWRDIISYNDLRYPYISTNEQDQFGDVQVAPILLGSIAEDAIDVFVDEVLGLYPEQRIQFDLGDVQIMRVIATVTLDPPYLTLDQPPGIEIPITAIVTVYSPIYDVVGRVARPGENLLVPISLGVQRASAVIAQEGGTESERLYGIDLDLRDGLLSATIEGDFTQISGIENLKQAIKHRFIVPRGSYMQHPRYGSGFEGMLGSSPTAITEFLAIVESRQTVLRDPRIERIGELTATIDGDTLRVIFSAITTSDEEFPSTQLNVKVS